MVRVPSLQLFKTYATRSTSRNATTVASSCNESPEVQRALAAYPLFNLNDESGRHLGPRRGDEAVLTLSGGVDSSVAAYLAMQEGGLVPHKTVFMRNWNSLEEGASFEPAAGGSTGCQWKQDWEKVTAMADWLGVEAELMDLSTPYWNTVFSPALDEWACGLTPNPDIMCNREIKFGELLRQLDQDDSLEPAFGRRKRKRWLVTGHYAGLQYYLPHMETANLHGRLYRAKDLSKDQSYFLSAVGSEQLGRTHLPLSHLSKNDVRNVARALGMPTSESEESMGLCFVGERKRGVSSSDDRAKRSERARISAFAGFLGGYLEAKSGKIVTMEGKVVGEHSGLHTLTIGQGARVGGAKERYFVAAKRATENEVVVVPGSNHAWLQCRALRMASFDLINKDAGRQMLEASGDLLAQIRHRQDAVLCKVRLIGSQVEVCFQPALSSVAEGQVCALYRGQQCLGSGVITSVETEGSLHVF